MLAVTENEDVEKMPVTPDTLVDHYTEFPTYKDFLSFFVSGVVGIRQFDWNKCHLALRKYISVSDEAFTVLTLENNWDRWSDMAHNDEWKDSDEPSKWTTSNEKQKGVTMNQATPGSDGDDVTPKAKRYRGWLAKGIARYNQIFNEVKAARATKNYEDFETYCTREFIEDNERLGKQKSKRQRTDSNKALPSARHKLWEDEDQIEEEEEETSIRNGLPAALKHIGQVGSRTTL
jgi:hypothetical protein